MKAWEMRAADLIYRSRLLPCYLAAFLSWNSVQGWDLEMGMCSDFRPMERPCSRRASSRALLFVPSIRLVHTYPKSKVQATVGSFPCPHKQKYLRIACFIR